MNIFQKLSSAFGGDNTSSLPLEIKKVSPGFWWSGLGLRNLQILFYGENLKDCKVKIDSEDITIEEIVFFLNPHYMILYLNVEHARPQDFTITLKKGGKVKQIPYTLKERRSDEYARGFDASDVIYLFMPDRFSQGDARHELADGMLEKPSGRTEPDGRHGGDIKGIINHLDYFKKLGVTALWPTPMLENNMPSCSYHGYAITDYYHIDPRFGTNEDYLSFVREAHRMGLKVIMDMVFNHCGSENYLFKDMPYHDWFCYGNTYTQTNNETLSPTDIHAAAEVRKKNKDGWFVKSMPNWNQENRYVADYLIQNSIWWIEYAGIDGVRQDTYPYCEPAMMARWCKTLTTLYPQLNIVGETWIHNNIGVACWQKDCKLVSDNSYLPTVMDFPLMGPLRLENGGSSLQAVYNTLAQDVVFANPMNLLIFLENHDTERFFRTKEETMDIERYKQALTLLLTLRGIPQLYCGTEVMMYGDKAKGDGTMRKDFPGGWPDDKANAFTGEGLNAFQREAFDFTSRLLHWRKGNQTIAKGTLVHFPPKDGIYVYCRKYENRTTTVVLNCSDRPKILETTYYKEAFPGSEAHEVLTERDSSINIHFALASKDIQILEFAK